VPQDLLPQRPRRAVPYLYADAEIRALMEASCVIPTPHRAATMRALIGLLAVTGMRIGEAIRLDQGDIDHQRDTLTVVESKFGKSRQLAVDATTTAALRAYMRRRDRPVPAEPTDAVFTSAVGTRLTYCNAHLAFKRIVAHAGLQPRSTVCRPRPHDLRHTFAVNALLDAYRDDTGDSEHIQTRIALLCTYLGHVNPGSTYWYLQAAPELLELAAERLERAEGGTQ
jgi:integrase